jgi:hypothetical protein
MKIVELNELQFHNIYARLLPSERISGGLPTPSIVLPYLDTLFVLQGRVQYGSVAGLEGDLKPSQLIETIKNVSWVDSMTQGK